jgi:redox-sensitive bicupin YhaK (pirin superfamily)
MSWNPANNPECETDDPSLLDTLIIPRARDIAGFPVRRALPAPKRQMVGPFIFFDQMGPADFVTGEGIDVRPHPHIGLGTVTYLLAGELQHQDSLGTNAMIRPGEVNWMVAGKGVTHSERTSQSARKAPGELFGIQTWLALPESSEEVDPLFQHRGRPELPVISDEGIHARLIMGSAYGEQVDIDTFSEMFYLDLSLDAGAKAPLPSEHEDRGVYVLSGAVSVAGQEFEAGQMMVFRPGDAITLHAGTSGARLLLLGGETLNGPRYIWWNFVSSSREKIEEAKRAWSSEDWSSGMFSLPPDDDEEFVPLPGLR